MIQIKKYNNTFIKIDSSDRSVLNHLQDTFCFDVPGAQHMPKFKCGMWDGKLRLFNMKTRQIYYGLKDSIISFLETNEYEYEDLTPIEKTEEISRESLNEFIQTLNIPFELRESQFEAVYNSINDKRCLNLIPTGGGKSLVVYILIRYMLQTQKSTLIIVPTVNLVTQLKKDFENYSKDDSSFDNSGVYCISGGKEKTNENSVTISTWQSIHKLGAKWLNVFDLIVCDEVHLATSACISKIFEDATEVERRIGLSGTLRDSKTNKLVLEGLFGKVYEYVTTRQLIDEGQLSDLKIRGVILQYEDHIKKVAKNLKYEDEVDFLISHTGRNKFITKLALQCKGPTLVIFSFVEKHGVVLYDMIKEQAKDRPVFILTGNTKDDERERVKELAKTEDVIMLASYSLFSTGTNIPTLANLIFAHPRKSKISILQSIGRILRKAKNKKSANLYDIADDLSHGKKINTTFKHFQERIGYYSKAKFEYSINELKIK